MSTALQQENMTSTRMKKRARRWGKGEIKKHLAFGTMQSPDERARRPRAGAGAAT